MHRSTWLSLFSTDGQTDRRLYRSNTALCVASRGKNPLFFTIADAFAMTKADKITGLH